MKLPSKSGSYKPNKTSKKFPTQSNMNCPLYILLHHTIDTSKICFTYSIMVNCSSTRGAQHQNYRNISLRITYSFCIIHVGICSMTRASYITNCYVCCSALHNEFYNRIQIYAAKLDSNGHVAVKRNLIHKKGQQHGYSEKIISGFLTLERLSFAPNGFMRLNGGRWLPLKMPF